MVTPIQMISAYAAVANGGLYNPPHLVESAPGANLPERNVDHGRKTYHKN